MGEGIRNAKVVSLLKETGRPDRSSTIRLRSRNRQSGLSDRVFVRRNDGRMENESRRHCRDRPGARHDSGRRRRRRARGSDRGRRGSFFGSTAQRSERIRLNGGNATNADARAKVRWNRAGALADDHAPAEPRRSGESANRCALGRDSQSARRGEEERRKECAVAFRHARLGGRARDGKTRAVSPSHAGGRSHCRER